MFKTFVSLLSGHASYKYLVEEADLSDCYSSMASIGPISAMLTPTRKYRMKLLCAKFRLNRARNVEYMIKISFTTVSKECSLLR